MFLHFAADPSMHGLYPSMHGRSYAYHHRATPISIHAWHSSCMGVSHDRAALLLLTCANNKRIMPNINVTADVVEGDHMKHFPRLGLYKASNLTFDPRTTTAVSYAWWEFVRTVAVPGVAGMRQVVFNEYPYSPTTRKHQAKVRALLEELNIAYTSVYTRHSLSKFAGMEDINEACIEQAAEDREALEAKRVMRNLRAKQRRLQSKRAIEAARPALRLVGGAQ